MILIENPNKNLEDPNRNYRTVLVFDFYTFDKIVEFEVDTTEPSYLDREDYNSDNDTLNPQFNAVWATADTFPKITWWNEGRYILSCVGAKPESKVWYEFRVYDSVTHNITSTVRRLDHDSLSGLLLDVNYNPKDPESLVMIFKEGPVYSIIEVDLITARTTDLFSITTTSLHSIKLAEDLSQIFVIKSNEDNSAS